jgi:hypothetical protein
VQVRCRRAHSWSGFDIRTPACRGFVQRMSNPKLHEQITFTGGSLILTFAKRSTELGANVRIEPPVLKNAVPGPKEPGTRALIAAQYSQNSPKNNGQNGILSADFGANGDGPKGHIGPIRHLSRRMTGPVSSCPARSDRPRAGPLQNASSRPRCRGRSGPPERFRCGSGWRRAGFPGRPRP